MKTRTHALAAALLALPLAGCGDLFYAETEVAEACLMEPQSFPGVIGDGTFSFEYDLGSRLDILTQDHVTYELRIVRLGGELVGDGAVNLSNVERIRLWVTSAPLPDRLVLDYVPDPANPTPNRIPVASNPNIDLGPYLESGLIGLRLEMDAAPGTNIGQFTSRIDACFYVRARLDYDEYVF